MARRVPWDQSPQQIPNRNLTANWESFLCVDGGGGGWQISAVRSTAKTPDFIPDGVCGDRV
jgi:hypothetical protein